MRNRILSNRRNYVRPAFRSRPFRRRKRRNSDGLPIKASLSVRANDFRTDIYTIFECALSNGDACFVRRSRIMKRWPVARSSIMRPSGLCRFGIRMNSGKQKKIFVCKKCFWRYGGIYFYWGRTFLWCKTWCMDQKSGWREWIWHFAGIWKNIVSR